MKKKTSGKASTSKGGSQRDRLARELQAALKEIDEEGLLFLLRQAHVLIHNVRVDRLNREAEELAKKTGKSSEAPRVRVSPTAVSIDESEDGKAIFLVLGRTRKAMSMEEIKQLVRICYGAETKTDALRQLFTVFSRERKDILIDAGIGGPSHPLMEGLFREVRAKYRLEDR